MVRCFVTLHEILNCQNTHCKPITVKSQTIGTLHDIQGDLYQPAVFIFTKVCMHSTLDEMCFLNELRYVIEHPQEQNVHQTIILVISMATLFVL